VTVRGKVKEFGEGAWGAPRSRGDPAKSKSKSGGRREFGRPAKAFAGLAALCAGLHALGTPSAALAADQQQSQLLQTPGMKIDKNAPLLLQADELIYDREHDRIIAKGHVEIYYNNYTVQAEDIIYDKRANTLTARGNVRIKEPDGSLINAENITLSTDFRDGFIRSLKVVTKEQARIGAANAYRKDGEATVFDHGVFTPCKPCESDPDKAPLWRIKATKITDIQSEGNIYFEDASMEFFGVPVAWVPYFSMPDPTVKRRSGFLAPSFITNNDANLGYGARVPYYFALDPSYDLTLTPLITTEAGTMVDAEWRQRLSKGAYKIDLAGAYNENPPDGDSAFRGSVKSQGEFALSSFWRWGWDATAQTDDTFRRFYKLDGVLATDQISRLYMEGVRDRNYFSASLYRFGGLTETDTSAANSSVLPIVDYNYIFADPVVGGELSFNANAFSLSRNSVVNYTSAAPVARDVNQVVAEVAWRRSLTDSIGEVFTPFAKARGDVMNYQDFNVPGTPETESQTIERGMVTAGLDYRYPFVKHSESATHVVEPVGQIIVRPNLPNQTNLPNEDAQSLVLDDTLLFDTDKFSGYDRIETGARANVGLQYTLMSMAGWSARLVAGESIQVAGDNPFEPGSGLARTRSDYVTGAYLNMNQHLRLIAQTRFDEESFELKREDLVFNGSYGPFTSSLGYMDARAAPEMGFLEDREEIMGKAAIQLDTKWSVFADARFDIDSNQMITDDVGIKYSDECFTLSAAFVENYIQDADLKPNHSFLIRYDLKYLGAGQIGGGATMLTDPLGASSAQASALQ
jgi:LPS-assembly protein